MLIEFKVGNFLSFKDTQILRMAPVLNNDGDGTRFGEPSNLMFIYGANGAGKSNLVKAMCFSRDLALRGYSSIVAKRYNRQRGPSYFEYVVSIDGKIYSYGFEIKLETMEVRSEWLYVLKPEEDECLYEYELDKDESNTNRSLVCRLKMNSSDIGGDFRIVHDWLENYVMIENSRMRDEIIPVSDDILEILSQGLKQLDTGITEVQAIGFRNEEIPINLINRINNKDRIREDGSYLAIVKGNEMKKGWFVLVEREGDRTEYSNISFVHGDYTPDTTSCESLGTFRIVQTLALISMLRRKHDDRYSSLVVVDELECSVHTAVVEDIIRLFYEHAGDRGQLVTTTHKAYILTISDLDERNFSFIDMDRSGESCSRLYSMSSLDHDFKDRRRAYLDGRMSAIPFFTDYHD